MCVCVCVCVCDHGNNVPFQLSPQQLYGNSHVLGHKIYGYRV